MAIVTVDKGTYTVAEPLYQWDLNQVLEIRGLSLPKIPAVHFANEAMGRAIVRQATMDDAGIVRVDIPNSLLQKPYKVTAWVCIYEGETFETQYKLMIPVNARNQPADYTIEGDEEIYSFIELENAVANALVEVAKAEQSYNEAVGVYGEAEQKYDDAKAILDGTSAEFAEGLADVEELKKLVEQEYAVKPKTAEITLAASGWTGVLSDDGVTEESPWHQPITHGAITAETKIDLNTGVEVLDIMSQDGTTHVFVENNGGTAQAVALGKKPTVDLTVQATFTEVGNV